MKKHLFGFALFSLIVGATAFVYAMFNVVRVDEVPAPSYYQTYSPSTSCWKMKKDLRESRLDSPKINQAVFNLKTQQLNWELVTPTTYSTIALHFFVKDENGSRYITSENINTISNRGKLNYTATASSENGKSEIINITSSYEGLDDLDSYENLYVIAESAQASRYSDKRYQPKFDAARATPVLIDSGR